MKSLLSPPALLLSLAIGTTGLATSQQSSGCGKPVPSVIELGKPKNLTIASDSGVTPRKYRIHVPEYYDPNVPVPLILSFHGRSKDMKFQDELSQFSNASYGFEGIAVYPEGVPSPKGTKQWQGDPDAPTTINDITFTLELLDHLLSRYCIDPSLIYASGKSNGGGFTGLLACDPLATTRIAAFAAVSGAFYLDPSTQQLPPCTPSPNRPKIPILELHGAKDTTIHYLGGPNDRSNGDTLDIPAWVDGWAARNGLEASENVTGTLCEGKKEVTTHTWGDGVVVHYLYGNMYHDWPSRWGDGDSRTLTTCVGADATRVLLEWFGGWRL